MIPLLATIGRVLVRRWPALLAWYLGGTLVHYFAIMGAAQVGATSASLGFLILPLAVLVRLVSFVAMFLVVRDGLRELQAIAPLPENGADRRRTFVVTLLGSILPFFAIYTAWGFMRDDVDEYALRALAIRSGLSWQALAEGREPLSGGAVLEVQVTAVSLFTIVAAFSARWAFKRFGAKLPKWTTLIAVYFEAVWVFYSLFFISYGFDAIGAWVDSRVAMVWLGDIREWFAAWLAPIAWAWDAIGVLIGNIMGLLVQPLAWLTIAGVIYGQAIAAEQPGFQKRFDERTKKRFSRLPQTIARWLTEFVGEFTGRFRPLLNAIVLMWRAGPLLIASYVLLYTIVLALEPSLEWLLTRIIGPQHRGEFWMAYGPALFLLVPAVLEPLRIAVVSGSYDSTLGRLRRKPDQGSIENRSTEGTASDGTTSTQNGPSASDGTTNATMSS